MHAILSLENVSEFRKWFWARGICFCNFCVSVLITCLVCFTFWACFVCIYQQENRKGSVKVDKLWLIWWAKEGRLKNVKFSWFNDPVLEICSCVIFFFYWTCRMRNCIVAWRDFFFSREFGSQPGELCKRKCGLFFGFSWWLGGDVKK